MNEGRLRGLYGFGVAALFLAVALWRWDLVAEAWSVSARQLAAGGPSRWRILAEMLLFGGLLWMGLRVIPIDPRPRHDACVVLFSLVVGTVVETWGTRQGFWHYYTAEKPPFWILPIWPLGALAVDRLAAAAEVRWGRRLNPQFYKQAYGLLVGLSFLAAVGFLRSRLMVAGTFVFLAWLMACWIVKPRWRSDFWILAVGMTFILLGDFWGTTNGCWTYYTQTGSCWGLFRGISFGMAMDMAVMLTALKLARGLSLNCADQAEEIGAFGRDVVVSEKEVVDYYDDCEVDYRWVWNLKESRSLHYGYWTDNTKTLHEALLNVNNILIKKAGLKPEHHVLDAGCGVGGTAVFIAAHVGCRVRGITLSEKQVASASQLAAEKNVADLVKFEKRNFTSTGYPEDSFDAVCGIESICHANSKEDFLREAYRILKSGGRLVIIDFYKSERAFTAKEASIWRNWTSAWKVPDFSKFSEILEAMKRVGFREVSMSDETPHILPSARRLYRYFFPALIVTKVSEFLGRRNRTQTNNVWSAYFQYQALRRDLWRYGIVVGTK